MRVGLLSVFISLSFSLWIHILFSDVFISICVFFVIFPSLNIIMHEIYKRYYIKKGVKKCGKIKNI